MHLLKWALDIENKFRIGLKFNDLTLIEYKVISLENYGVIIKFTVAEVEDDKRVYFFSVAIDEADGELSLFRILMQYVPSLTNFKTGVLIPLYSLINAELLDQLKQLTLMDLVELYKIAALMDNPIKYLKEESARRISYPLN